MPIYFQIITHFRLDYNKFDKVHFVSHIFIQCNANISYEMTFYHCTSIVSSYVKLMLTLVLVECSDQRDQSNTRMGKGMLDKYFLYHCSKYVSYTWKILYSLIKKQVFVYEYCTMAQEHICILHLDSCFWRSPSIQAQT